MTLKNTQGTYEDHQILTFTIRETSPEATQPYKPSTQPPYKPSKCLGNPYYNDPSTSTDCNISTKPEKVTRNNGRVPAGDITTPTSNNETPKPIHIPTTPHTLPCDPRTRAHMLEPTSIPDPTEHCKTEKK